MARTKTAEDKRQLILNAAASVFDEHGYAETTIDMVAAAADIAKGSVYSYFTSKQDLYTAVFMQHMASEETDLLQTLHEAASPTDRLMRLFDHWYERYGHHKQIGRLVLECWAAAARESQGTNVGPMADMLHELYDRWRQRMAEIVAAGQETGEFRPDLSPTMAAQVIMAVLDGLTLQGILGTSVVIHEEFLARLKRGFLTVLAVSPASAGPMEDTTDDRDAS